jgi:molecular chaperone HscB
MINATRIHLSRFLASSVWNHSRSFFSSSGKAAAANEDYFQLFQIPRAFSIDDSLLKQQYRTLMKELHPDVNSNSVDDTASAVTHAYDTLRRPHLRASHLMELLGHPLREGSNESVTPEFLMDMMEWREQVANIDHDDGGHDVKIREILQQATFEMEKTGLTLQNAVDNGDFNTAHRCTGELQYWNRLIETLRNAVQNIH